MLIALVLAGVVLLGLGATTDHLVRRAEADFPPRGVFATAGGLRQHVIDTGGDQPPLVMIHGAYGSAGDFAVSLIPALRDRFRCIAIDRPGQGYSDRGGDDSASPAVQAKYLHAALQQMGVRRSLLLGFSFGGAVALAYALAYPDEAAGLVLVSPASHPWRDSPPLPFGISDAPLVGPLLRRTIVTPLGYLLRDRAVAAIFAPGPVPPGFAGAPVALAIRPSAYMANATDIRGLDAFLRDQSRLYPSLRLPVEIVASRDDPSVSPVLHAGRLSRDIPGARLALADSGGHPLHFSRPEMVLEAVARAEDRTALSQTRSPAVASAQ